MSKINEQMLEKFSTMMIERMENMKNGEWTKGWFTSSVGCMPINLSGRAYNGSNSLMLLLWMMKEGDRFRYPIFGTFNQISKLGGRVHKGEKSFPVFFWKFLYVNKEDNKDAINESDYRELSEADKEHYKQLPIMQFYTVFNLAQTTLEEDAPLAIERLKSKHGISDAVDMPTDTDGMYINAEIDEMLTTQSWVCPINYQKQYDSCIYNKADDSITIPLKSQFRKGTTEEEIYENGQEYYSSLVHEMVHSTGHKSRLDRFSEPKKTDSYAEEELIAELGAALIGSVLGFGSRVIDNNAKYLDCWIKQMRQEPKYILKVITRVNKAAKMVMDGIGIKQELELATA